MIRPDQKLARRLEEILHERAPDAKTDEEFVELVLPHLLGACCLVVPERRIVAIVDREFPERGGEQATRRATKPAHARTPSPPIAQAIEAARPCWRNCGKTAVKERWNPAPEGISWRPVCAEHAEGAGFTELRELPRAPREGART